MNTRILTIILILFGLLAISNTGYGCNIEPVADLVVEPNYVIKDTVVILDASNSYDPNGYIINYKWDFDNNDGYYDYYETSSNHLDGIFDGITTHIYDSNGTFTAKLHVTDDDPYSTMYDTNTVTINVSGDGDDDNLPVNWESANWLSDSNSNDADTDFDSDGYNNLSEYLHCTDPNDNSSTPSANIAIKVPGDVSTIQRAINAAIAGDEIWVAGGTYTLTSEIDVDKAVDIYGGFTGTEVSLSQRDWLNNVTTVNGNSSVRCFDVSANTTIDGFTITKGKVTNANGGGMRISGASTVATVKNCTFTKNNVVDSTELGTPSGGAIYDVNATTTIDNCAFAKNKANHSLGRGGAIASNLAVVTIKNSVFCKDEAGNLGGAVYIVGPDVPSQNSEITNCTFSSNEAAKGGGIYNYGGSLVITNCVMWSNEATSDGNSIYNYEYASTANDADLIAWWKLNETSGTTAYDSKGSDDGDLSGGATWTTSGNFDGALSLDGIDDHVKVASLSDPLDELCDGDNTVCMWVRCDDTNNACILTGSGGGGTDLLGNVEERLQV